MGDTKIEWTNKTWNPVRGCSVVSEGCRNCYAMNFAARFAGEGMPYEGLAYRNGSGAHWTGKVRLVEEHLEDPLRWKKRCRIFVNSMSDLFHESLTDAQIDRVFAVMVRADRHIFQVLTKRPQRMKDYFAADAAWRIWKGLRDDAVGAPGLASDVWGWLKHVWLGTSVEDQKTADERIPLLLQTPAAVRWISAEPLLGPVDLSCLPFSDKHAGCEGDSCGCRHADGFDAMRFAPSVDWVVCGGESGPRARPMHPDWARSLRDQCVAAGVPFFFKQWGEWANVGVCDDPCGRCVMALRSWDGSRWRGSELTGTKWEAGNHLIGALQLHPVGKKKAGRLLDGREWNQFPRVSRVGASERTGKAAAHASAGTPGQTEL